MSLQEAYCYESDVKESAEQAHEKLHAEKQDLHYFYPDPLCATRVTAKCRLDTFYLATAFDESIWNDTYKIKKIHRYYK